MSTTWPQEKAKRSSAVKPRMLQRFGIIEDDPQIYSPLRALRETWLLQNIRAASRLPGGVAFGGGVGVEESCLEDTLLVEINKSSKLFLGFESKSDVGTSSLAKGNVSIDIKNDGKHPRGCVLDFSMIGTLQEPSPAHGPQKRFSSGRGVRARSHGCHDEAQDDMCLAWNQRHEWVG